MDQRIHHLPKGDAIRSSPHSRDTTHANFSFYLFQLRFNKLCSLRKLRAMSSGRRPSDESEDDFDVLDDPVMWKQANPLKDIADGAPQHHRVLRCYVSQQTTTFETTNRPDTFACSLGPSHNSIAESPRPLVRFHDSRLAISDSWQHAVVRGTRGDLYHS